MQLWKIGGIATISILSYNILKPTVFIIFVIIMALIGGFIYFQEKRSIILYGIIFMVYWLMSAIFIFNGEITAGELHWIKGEYNGKNIVISSIDGKGICKSMIFKNDNGEILKGRGKLLVKAEKLEKLKNRYILNGEIVEIKKGNFDEIRDYISLKVEKISYNKKIYGIIVAIILGDNSGLSDELQKGFRYTGTAHIIVISGLHIAIIVVSILKIADMLKLSYRKKYIITFIILTFYCFTVGMSPSVARSYIMGTIFLMSKILWEKSEVEKSFWISYVGILFFNPASLYSISFQLSFAAIFALIYVFELIKYEKDNFFTEMLKMSFIVQIVLSPFFIIYFGTMPVLSVLANFVAIPIGTVLVQVLFGAVVITTIIPYFDGILILISKYSIEILLFYVNIFDKIPLMQIEVNSGINGVVVLFYTVFSGGIVYYLMKKKEKIIQNIEKSKELKIF